MIRASTCRRLAGLWRIAVACLVVWIGATGSADAQAPRVRAADEPVPAAGLTPFPENDVYRIQVYGDAFAEGLTAGLVDVMANSARVQVQRKHKAIGALVRPEWDEEIRGEETSREVVNIGVLMLGLQDRQAIRVAPGMKPFAIGSDEWRDEYGQRLDRVIKALRKRGMVLYMVGQPVLRQPNANSQAEMLNEVMRQRATANGAKFIDIFEAFQEEGGGFTQFGPDVSGNRVKLREGDGITFTAIGNKQLAFFVDKEIKRDVEQAVSDRAIPLAGDEAEQKKVNPAKQATAAGQPANWKGSVTVGQSKAGVQPQVPVAPTTADASGDQKADNSKVTVRSVAANGREEMVTLEILRPAIPAAVIALVTRREAGADKTAQPGEAVVEEIGGGLTVVNSVSALGDGVTSSGGGRRKVPPTQSAFYLVLVKGERPMSKPGRADDFTWPRTDAVIAEPTAAPAVPAGAPRVSPGAGQPSVRPGPAGAVPAARGGPRPPNETKPGQRG